MSNKTIIFLLLTISWLPITGMLQPLVYVLPIAILIISVLFGKVVMIKSKTYVLLFLFCITLIMGNLFVENGLAHYILGAFLLIPIFISTFRFRAIKFNDIVFLVVLISVYSILEFVVGVVQLILFQGLTLNFSPNSWDKVLGTTLAASSHIYSLKMLFQGVFIVYSYKPVINYNHKLKYLLIIGIITSFIGAVISSFMIGIIFSILGFIALGCLNVAKSVMKIAVSMKIKRNLLKRSFYTVFISLIFIGITTGVLLRTQADNVQLIVRTINMASKFNFSDNHKFQKIFSYQRSIEEVLLRDIKNFTFGVGLGRYSSRAALILTGDYLNNHPDYIATSMSDYTEDYIYPLWDAESQRIFRGSVLALPTSSILAIVIETGIIGSLIFFFYFISFRKKPKHVDHKYKFIYSFYALTFIVLLLQIVMDLWLEVASFMIFIYLIMFIINSINKAVDKDSIHT